MPGVNMPKGFDKKNYKFSQGFPTRENCDLENPREMFLWALVALPGQNGAQLVMPVSYLMMMSEHLHEVGAMLTCPSCGFSKQPQKAYVPPSGNDPHWLTSPGRWVDPAVAPQRDSDPLEDALDAMPAIQQAALFERLKKRHEAGEL
ncbi:minor tail protein [Mycobacterium phage LilSpotty]|uniref:Minor tail protein n=1 Tax=Mycobacterium phage LilSpotty TaxID=2588512 RepID=A0A4Y6EQ45_9CAUD|nr:minor tail protein [Mycobacterium phage LilSpotty]QDF19751.1 minor tail protein [Mycobacterium phage LilSpotty]